MCSRRRRRTPQLPPPPPPDSAIEMTADRVVLGDKRKENPKEKNKIATKVTRKRFIVRYHSTKLLVIDS